MPAVVYALVDSNVNNDVLQITLDFNQSLLELTDIYTYILLMFILLH